ncbi:MAG: hypothetical protein O9353_09445, partial [Bacteroidia bacterium]|nr:hypothetical protein [Bacteroidia bacterium]
MDFAYSRIWKKECLFGLRASHFYNLKEGSVGMARCFFRQKRLLKAFQIRIDLSRHRWTLGLAFFVQGAVVQPSS